MNKIFLSPQAYASLISLPSRERLCINKALLQMSSNPDAGFKLWGRQDIYLCQTCPESRIIYRLHGERILVLAIKALPEYIESTRKKISAVVLAAGKDEHKEGLPLASMAESLLEAGVNDLVVVLGYQAEETKKELQGKDVKVIVNPDYQFGLSKSLKYGLRIVARDTQAVFLALGNRPFIKPAKLKQMIRAYKSQASPIIMPAISLKISHPIMFDNLLIPELMKARGNIGGRGVLRHHRRETMQVRVKDKDLLKV